MPKQPLLLCLALLVLQVAVAQTGLLRVMSYNIRNAKGLDNVTDYQRIADVLLNAKADVIALQELDSVTQRSKQEDVLKNLAQLTGMYKVYAPAIDFNGGKYGVGVLSKEKPLSFRYLSLPGREEKRVLLLVEYERYFFLCTHLSLTEEDRVASASMISNEVARLNKPVILAGDLNDHPTSVFMKSLQAQWKLLSIEADSFPADRPDRCIDYILTRKQDPFKVRSSIVIDEPLASDHRPVLVVLEW